MRVNGDLPRTSLLELSSLRNSWDEEALAATERLIQIAPNAAAYTQKGLAHCSLKQFNEALVIFEYSIHLDPNFAPAYSNKGMALCGLRRYSEALVAIERAIDLDSKLSFAHIYKSFALQGLGRSYEAEEAYRKALQLGL